MTLSERLRNLDRSGRPAPGVRPRALLVVRSAEGQPNRDLGFEVRAPKPISAAQAAWLRETRPA